MSVRHGGFRRHFAWLLAASLGLAVLASSGGAVAQMQGGTIVWGKPNDVDSLMFTSRPTRSRGKCCFSSMSL